MSLKNIINQIFNDNTNYLQAQQALNQARSLKSLSNDLYTDSLRFVYELVQNCDDACQDKSILRIATIDHRYLIICHNGKPFDEDDLRGLCDVGCSTKGRDEQKTGYKGLGFKAVFGKSDYVLIASKGEYFRFEENSKVFQWNRKWGVNQQVWEQIHGRTFEYPWQICPIWTEKNQVPETIQKWLLGQLDAVATIIRLKNVRETYDAIKQLIEQPQGFMFLRNIKDVRFSINSPQEIILNISPRRDSSVQIKYDSKVVSHWLLCRCDIDIPDHARDDPRLPVKLQNAETIEITLAAKIDKNDNIESVQGRNNALFAYLPTKITLYNLPIVVNAQFLTNASREHIATDSLWNQYLFSRIPIEIIKWIGELMKQDKWNQKALDLLPNPISVQDSLAEKYNDNCLKADIEIPFLLNIQKKLLKISEAVIDVTDFSRPDCIGNDLVRDFIVRTFSSTSRIASHPFISNSSRLRKFKILLFTWDHCLAMLNCPDFQLNFTPDQDIIFITYLFNNQRQTHIQARLRELPFLMDHNGVLRVPNSIYLPSQFSNDDWAAINDTDPYIHNDIMSWLQTKSLVIDWLKLLGVREKTDELYINGWIIPIVRDYATPRNTIPTIKKLFSSVQHGRVRNDILPQLNKLKLLSVAGTLIPADELYFSDPYFPRLSLNSFHLDPASFLSPIYLNEIKGDPNLLKQFFLFLGVQEDIKLIQFSEDQHSELVAAYQFKQTEQLFRYGSLQFRDRFIFPFLEVTQRNYDFALYFWQHIIHSINVNQINQKELLVSAQQQSFQVDNLPYWFVRTRVCIPTTTRQLLKSTDVFSSDLRSIAGDLLPVFACTTTVPFPVAWQHFFQFKSQLSLADHIQLLNAIYDRSHGFPIDDDNETCIQRVYTSLMNCLSRSDKNSLDQSRPNASFSLLSTINNEFRPCSSLVVTLTKDFTLPKQIAQLKLSAGNTRDKRLPQLLDYFNIRQIGMNDLALSPNIDVQLSLTLRVKLRDMQPYLYELACNQNIINHRIDYDLEIFETDGLELFYNDTIPVLQKDIHIVDNRIYIKRPWTSNEVMSKLPQILCQQFKLPTNNESDIRQFLFNDQINSSTMFLAANPSLDLLGMEGTRAKFSMTIDRDNEQLFTLLNMTQTTNPAELLTQALDAQRSEYCGYVYHYTHLENAVSILRDRAIKCRNRLSSDDFKDSAAANVIQTTRQEVKDYARFYFRPHTPTQRCDENLGLSNLSQRYGNQPMCPVPIIFRIELDAILAIDNIQWKVGLGNMANHQTESGNTIDIVKRFDFQGVYADIRTERGKYSSQQEFLIESELNLDQLLSGNITIIFQDENARDSLEHMITHDYRSTVTPSFYYGLNSRIMLNYTDVDNEIVVSITEMDPLRKYGQLIVQLSGNETNRTVQGNLNASYQRGIISTFYSNQQLSFIANIQYAIYYQEENQVWLIHTNSSRPQFSSPIQMRS